MATIQFRQHQAEVGESGLTSQASADISLCFRHSPKRQIWRAAATFLPPRRPRRSPAPRRALLLRFEIDDEHLMLSATPASTTRRRSSTDRRAEPPVDGGDARALAGVERPAAARGRRIPFDDMDRAADAAAALSWRAGIWSDAYAEQVLAPIGARLVRSRTAASAARLAAWSSSTARAPIRCCKRSRRS